MIYTRENLENLADKINRDARIRDKVLNSWVSIDGTPSNNSEETHFKIKKREEM